MTPGAGLPERAGLASNGRVTSNEAGPAVRWSESSPEEDARLLPWRRAVGPPLVMAPSGQSAASGGPVVPAGAVVVVWNLRVGGGAVQAFWRHVEERAAGRAVVLLLQEAFSSGSHVPGPGPDRIGAGAIVDEPPGESRCDIVRFADHAGLHGFYVPSMGNGPRGEDRGNAILSTEPLQALAGVELPFERQRRVAAMASVEVAGITLRVCSVHLDNRAPWSRAWRSLGAARKRQMGALLERWTGAEPAVLGGDLNTWVRGDREGAFRLARARFPDPLELDERPTHQFEIGGWLRRSDHLMFRLPGGWRARVRRLDQTFGSDHYPLFGEVEPAA